MLSKLRFLLKILLLATLLPVASAQMLIRGNAIIVDGRMVIDDPKGVYSAARSPGGNFIAYSHETSDVVVVRSDGSIVRTLRSAKTSATTP